MTAPKFGAVTQLVAFGEDVTRQDKELTETVAALTREIHAAVRPG